MPPPVLPPGLLWPSEAAELVIVLMLKEAAVRRPYRGFRRQYEQARHQLLEALVAERVLTAFLISSNGTVRTLPGRFWHTPQQDYAWHGYFSALIEYPREQFWHFEEYPLGPLGYGFALVDEASVRRCFGDPLAEFSGGVEPERREKKSAFIMRALGLSEARSITTEETRPIAERWLRAHQLPCGKSEIDDEIKRMKASMRGQRRKP